MELIRYLYVFEGIIIIKYIYFWTSRGSGIAPPSNVNSLKIQKELLIEPVNSYVCYSF